MSNEVRVMIKSREPFCLTIHRESRIWKTESRKGKERSEVALLLLTGGRIVVKCDFMVM